MTVEKNTTLKDRIYGQILAKILAGELPPGSELDERSLTVELEVSRTPFREAIGSLAKDGLVEIAPYRGFSVRNFSLKEVVDLYALRRTLEAFAIRLATENISNAHIARFEEILGAAVSALRQRDMAAYGHWDGQFHGLIAELSDNAALIDALARISLQIQLCRVIANQSDDFVERAARERDEILDALRRRDADRAAALMDTHIADVQATVVDSLRKRRDGANDVIAEGARVNRVPRHRK